MEIAPPPPVAFKVPEVVAKFPDPKFKCSVSPKVFLSAESLAQHKSSHSLDRAFRCGLCTARYFRFR
jgi:hypothetical protein